MKNKAINAMCRKGTSYAPRKKTDVLFQMPAGSFNYKGMADRSARLIQDEYLINADTWRMFVEQYRTFPDDQNLGWKCEYWGKMMRGSVFTYEYTKDEVLYDTLVETVLDMLSAQQPDGRFTTYSVDKEFDGWDLWGRKYILLGFEYFLDICKDERLAGRIIEAICRHADYIMAHVGREEDGKKLITKCTRNWLGLNSSSILEPYMRLYNITGEKKYFDYATYIVECGGVSEGNVFEMAYEDKLDPYEYRTNKAYEMMSCFEGLLEYYRVTGIEKYKTAVVNFAKRVMNSDITIIGCSGCTHELFDNSAKNQLRTDYYGIMQETCVTVTWMKYCNQLLSITGDVAFADAIELSAYNAMLGAVNSYKIKGVLVGFPFDSYSPLMYGTRARSTGGFQVMKQGYYGCCACIGAAGTALIPLSSAMLAKDGVCMNLYLPGKIHTETPDGNDLLIDVDTKYPACGKVKMTLNGAAGESFKFTVRIPAFCKYATVSVNGETPVNAANGYYTIEREWNDGDVVELDLDVRVRTYRRDGNSVHAKDFVALYKGPVVLARDARLGEKIDIPVDIAEDAEGFVEVKPTKTAHFDVNMEYAVPMKDGSSITMIDYASAGKTWNRDSVMTAWMATKNYWNVDFSKPVYLNCMTHCNPDYCTVDEENALHGEQSNEKRDIFTLEETGDGYYYIRSADGRYLTLKGENAEDTAYFTEKLDCDCQKWDIRPFVQNRYEILHKKTGCHLWRIFGSPKYRLYALDPGTDKKFEVYVPQINVSVNAMFLIENA